MKNDTFYKQFLSAFEEKFQAAVHDGFTNSNDLSFNSELLSVFKNPVIPYIADGKRVRPFLIAVGADTTDDTVIDAGIAFEMLHTFILIHDDIMDGATLRRNVPTVHMAFESQNIPGVAAAITAGDFIFALANEYMYGHVPALMPIFTQMQRFLCIGQFYEMYHWGKSVEPQISENIALFKSAQYTFMYPLQFGLQLAGRDIHLLDNYARFAGLGFQMRDDWLDLTGEESGKDTELDTKNSVPNIVQNLYAANNQELDKTKNEVEKKLSEYQKNGLGEIQRLKLSSNQATSLTNLLVFSTTI